MVLDYEGTLLNTRDAAERLGVSASRVRSLAKNGCLKTVRYGRNIYMTETSVERYAGLNRKQGRLFSPRIAFAALYLISDREADWLTASERYRLRKLLAGLDASRLMTLCDRRAEVRDYWCMDVRLRQVAGRIRLSAASGDIAHEFGLVETGNVEGYVTRDIADGLVSDNRLVEDSNPTNVRLHIIDGWMAEDTGDMPVGVCAADLASSNDIREKYAGLEKLENLLNGFKRSEQERNRG